MWPTRSATCSGHVTQQKNGVARVIGYRVINFPFVSGRRTRKISKHFSWRKIDVKTRNKDGWSANFVLHKQVLISEDDHLMFDKLIVESKGKVVTDLTSVIALLNCRPSERRECEVFHRNCRFLVQASNTFKYRLPSIP